MLFRSLEQSKSQSLVYGIAIHAFLIGQPFRLRHFRRAMEHIAKHRDKIWIATSGEIAQHFIDHASIKPQRSNPSDQTPATKPGAVA